MQFPVSLKLLPSRRLRAALVLVHLIALGGLLAQAFLPKLLVFLLLSLSFVVAWRASGCAAQLALHEDGGLLYQRAGNEALPGRILSGTAFSWLVVLRIQLEDEVGKHRVQACVMLADSLSPAEFRKLQVWLRWVIPVKSGALRA